SSLARAGRTGPSQCVAGAASSSPGLSLPRAPAGVTIRPAPDHPTAGRSCVDPRRGAGAMEPEHPHQRLSSISTYWSVVCQTRDGGGRAVAAARQQLPQRYGPAVRRYLLGALRDPDATDEVFQEFALRFLRGGLRGADPQRGRFRNFLKGV